MKKINEKLTTNEKSKETFEKLGASSIRKNSTNIEMKFYVKEMASGNTISGAKDVFYEIKDLVKADQESFWVIYFNAKNKIIGNDCIFLGGINTCTFDMKILFRRILLNNASSFIVFHNHPSGNVNPSQEDIKITELVANASKILALRFLDHIIIGDNYYSFAKMRPNLF